MTKLKFKNYIEIIIVCLLLFFTIQYTIHVLNKNCISLYMYSEEDLSKIYKDKSIENLWFITNKIKIMDECKYKDYSNFLREVKNNNQNVDFAGYDWVSKGNISLSDLADEKLKIKGLE